MSTKDPDYVQEQTGQVISAFMTQDRLEELLPAAREATMTRAMGALVSFEGIVRDHDGGHRVATLTYSSHPTADAEIARIAQEIVVKHPFVRVWTAHRTGPIPIGEVAFIVLAAAAHRGDAFVAASELADRVKAEVPIWKEQELVSGDTQWVGLE
ncbi:molybdopterin synthase catalytic subunit [Corynebacterium sp. S7]